MNLNTVAKQIAAIEGKKKQQDIAQIKETLKCACVVFNGYNPGDVLNTIERTAKKYK